jgi:alanine dehydrogenase
VRDERLRIITNDDIRDRISMPDALQAYDTVLREYYAGNAVARPRIDVWSPTSNPEQFYQWGTMEGLSRHFGVFVTRMKSDIAYFGQKPDGTRTQEKFNTRPGLYCGLLWVFDIHTGTPLAIIQDGYLQHLRSGAKAGLAARATARPDAGVVGMLGSGGMARSHLRAFAAVRSIKQVRVYSPTRANREAYAREMEAELRLPVEPVDAPQAAVQDAQLIACCTSAIEPVLHGAWIPEGAFISVVKGSTELDAAAWERVGAVLSFARPGDEEEHRPSRGAVDGLSGHHRAYVAGQPEEYAAFPVERMTGHSRRPPLRYFKEILADAARGREDDREIIVFGGGRDAVQGLQFAAVAGLAWRLAEQRDLGHVLPDEWFLETERN